MKNIKKLWNYIELQLQTSHGPRKYVTESTITANHRLLIVISPRFTSQENLFFIFSADWSFCYDNPTSLLA